MNGNTGSDETVPDKRTVPYLPVESNFLRVDTSGFCGGKVMVYSDEKSFLNPATPAKQVHFSHVVFVDNLTVFELITPEMYFFQGLPPQEKAPGPGQTGPVVFEPVPAKNGVLAGYFLFQDADNIWVVGHICIQK